MRIYQPVVIPGILQTAEYAEAILKHSVDFYHLPDDMDETRRRPIRANRRPNSVRG